MNLSTNLIKKSIHEEVADLLGSDDAETIDVFPLISETVEKRYPLLPEEFKSDIASSVANDVTGYGFLEDLLKDENVNEIMINNQNTVFLEKSGRFERIEVDFTKQELLRLIQKIANSVGARCDLSSPIVDAWMKDGSRFHAVIPPIAPDGPYLTIRKFKSNSYSLNDYCLDQKYERIVSELIDDSKNVVVAGGTSSGKTTLLNCLIQKVEASQRVVSIEETAELNVAHSHWVRLLARTPNSEGTGVVSMGDLVKASLRMRPDRIVVGEVRSAEAFDLIQALNTGHGGSLCTIHANGPREVVGRIASLAMFAHPGFDYQALVSQVCFGIDAVIYVKRSNSGHRIIESITAIDRENQIPRLVDLVTGKISDV